MGRGPAASGRAGRGPSRAGAERHGGRTRWTWVGALLAVFVLLLWQVRGAGVVPALDVRVRGHVLDWAAAPWARPLDPWAHRLADLGDVVPAVPVLVAVAAAVALWRRSVRPALTALAALAVLGGIVVPAKLLIARPGPGTASLPVHQLGYFPSGHTADAMMCYGTALLILVAGAAPAVRRAAAAAFGMLIALIGAALVWCDYHWTSDVVGSLALCGAALALLAATLPGAGRSTPRGGG